MLKGSFRYETHGSGYSSHPVPVTERARFPQLVEHSLLTPPGSSYCLLLAWAGALAIFVRDTMKTPSPLSLTLKPETVRQAHQRSVISLQKPSAKALIVGS